tara:strand:- start:3753 stop:4055 length:303 start_codon:yes stop_codon:yes gene_type:complete
MPEDNNNNNKPLVQGTSATTLVQIIFFILKLTKVKPISNWEWWQVFLPWEINAGIMVLFGCCYCGIVTCVLCKKKSAEYTDEDINIMDTPSSNQIHQTNV